MVGSEADDDDGDEFESSVEALICSPRG